MLCLFQKRKDVVIPDCGQPSYVALENIVGGATAIKDPTLPAYGTSRLSETGRHFPVSLCRISKVLSMLGLKVDAFSPPARPMSMEDTSSR